jgi:hypothetical protein
MGNKYVIGLALLVIATFGGVVVTSFSKRLRDLFFVGMILLAPMTEDYDINFMSRDFYRGTTRGIEISLVDVLAISILVSSVLFPRQGQKRFFWPASFGLMLIFFAYCCFNVAIADPHIFGVFELSKMIRGMTIFLATAFFVQSEREMKLLLFALGLIICYQGAQGFRQKYQYHMDRVPGTLDDSNSLSVFLVTTAPLFVAAINSRIPAWLKLLSAATLGAACLGIVLTVSRMGVIVMGLTLLAATLVTISWKITARKAICTLVIICAAGGIAAKSWSSLEARFKTFDARAEYENKHNMGRGYYLRIARAIVEDRTFGVGLNNWSYVVSEKYGPLLGYKFIHYSGTDRDPKRDLPPNANVDDPQAAPAHCLLALMAGELGLPGMFLFCLLWLRWFQMGLAFLWKRTPDPMRRIGVGILFGLLGLFLQSLTEWVFRHSPIYYTAHILLGVLASLYYLKKQEAKALARQAAEAPEAEPIFEPQIIVEPAPAPAGA